MRIALITDIHAGVRNDSPYFHANLFRFIDGVFLPYLETNNIKDLLILGDTWDRRKYVNINTLYEVHTQFFDKLEMMGISVKIIYGNHDTYYRNTNHVNSVNTLLRGYKNLEIVETHKVFDFDGAKIGMISWINNQNLNDSQEWISSVDCDILCGHFEITGFEVLRGKLCEHGLSPNIFERFEYVFSGHFHLPSTDGRIMYLGNPCQTNWGDYGVKKGFHVFDTKSRTIEMIENPFNVYEKIVYDPDADILGFDYELYRDKIVRVFVTLYEQTEKRKFDLFMSKLSEVTISIDVQEDAPKEVNSIIIQESMDTKDIIEQFVDVTDGVDKVELRSYINEIYTEAMNRAQVTS